MNDKTETMARPAAIDDVVNDALGTAAGIHVGNLIDDKALLSKYNMEDIEVTFAMRDPATGDVLREKEPCYQCKADNFLGQALHGTFWPEGSIVVMHDIPNQHMEPLNRAAAVNHCRWLESLPQNKVTIDIADMAEAAVILAKDDRVEHMSPQQRTIAAIRVAEGLKLKRDGGKAMDLRTGDINRNFAPQSGGKSPPMLGAKMSDMSQIGPGMTRSAAAVTGPGANVRKGAPIGGPPPGR